MKSRQLLATTLISLSVFMSTAAAQLFDDHPVFNSYLSQSPPIVDGFLELGEWDAAGPPIKIDSMNTEAGEIDPSLNGHPYGGDEDLSFQFRTMWVAPWDLYFLVEINDNIAMDVDHETDRLWERDQLEFFIDGDQLTGGNIRWWDTDPANPIDSEDTAGPADPYGKFGFPRPLPNGDQRPTEGNRMSADPEDVGLPGVVASGIATATGENADYFVELHVSMQDAMENGLFDGTDPANFGTMIPDSTAIKFSIFISDNDNTAANVADDDGRTHGAGIAGGDTEPGPIVEGVQFYCTATKTNGEDICGLDDWWRSDKYPSLLMSSEYVPDVTADCDFDGSGSCDLTDLNELMYTGLASGDAKYDLNGSGTVDLDDRDEFHRQTNSLPGDANGDGKVDAQDLNAVGSNWQEGGKTSYSDGDFNGDGLTNAPDLNTLGIFWTKTAADFAGQAPLAAAVPEPCSTLLALVSLLGLLAFRTDR